MLVTTIVLATIFIALFLFLNKKSVVNVNAVDLTLLDVTPDFTVDKHHAPIFVLPSLLTDKRIFEPQTKHFPNMHSLSIMPTPNSETLNSVAEHIADYILNECDLRGKAGEKKVYYLGGFCVGGMISLLISNHLRRMAPDLQCKGVILVGSCASFIDCVDDKYLTLKKILLTNMPRSVIFSIVRFYLWLHKVGHTKVHGVIDTLVHYMSSTENSIDDAELNMKLIEMVGGKDPSFTTSLLISELNFNREDSEWDKFTVPIHHIHGSNDYLMPIHKVKAFKQYLNDEYQITYNLKELHDSGHFLTLSRPKTVSHFIHTILSTT